MSYTFRKYYSKNQKSSFDWVLVIDSIETLKKYHDKYFGERIDDSIVDLMIGSALDDYNTGKKIENKTTQLILDYSSKLPKHSGQIISGAMAFEQKVFKGKLKALFACGEIYVRDNSTYFTPNSDIELREEIIREEMIFPQYSKADIKISRYDGGNHYYAKIGRLEVSDRHGNIKWNTIQFAETVTKDFYNKIN